MNAKLEGPRWVLTRSAAPEKYSPHADCSLLHCTGSHSYCIAVFQLPEAAARFAEEAFPFSARRSAIRTSFFVGLWDNLNQLLPQSDWQAFDPKQAATMSQEPGPRHFG